MSTKVTITGITHGFISYMRDDEGCTESTLASYLNDLKVAHEFFGADTDVEALTPERVAEFFTSDAVTKKRGGAPKSPISIAKTQRVFRLALIWAVANALIEVAPLPQATKTATTKPERIDADLDDAPVGLAGGRPMAATAPTEAPEPPAPDAATDPVLDLPRFDHPEMVADPAPVAVAAPKAKRSKKKAS